MCITPTHVITSCSHSYDAFKKMKSLRETQSLCDVNIKIGETSIAAHKVVLASCSPYFEFMFTGKVTENGKTNIELKDLCPESVSALIEYVYSGFLVVNDDTIFKILKTADFLKITSAKEECLKFLQKNINASNCIAIKDIAKTHFFTELENKVNCYIRWNFLQVIQSEAFLKFTLNELKGFLSDSSFCLISSISQEAVSVWIQYDETSREGFKDELLTTVIGMADSLHQGNLDLCDPHRQKRIYIFCQSSGYTEVNFVDLKNFVLHEAPRRSDLDRFSCVCIKNAIYLIDTFRGKYSQYDSEEEKWAMTEMTSVIGFRSRACNVQDSVFLVADGESKRTFSFDVETNVLHAKPSLLYETNNPGIASNENCVYVCGGNCSSAERLDIRTKFWSSIAKMPRRVQECSAVSLGDYIYCIDGNEKHFHKYDIRNGKWTTEKAIPNYEYSYSTSISCTDDTLYAVNGYGIFQYSPTENTWAEKCSLNNIDSRSQLTCLCYVPQ